jgi:hypothetical protein
MYPFRFPGPLLFHSPFIATPSMKKSPKTLGGDLPRASHDDAREVERQATLRLAGHRNAVRPFLGRKRSRSARSNSTVDQI